MIPPPGKTSAALRTFKRLSPASGLALAGASLTRGRPGARPPEQLFLGLTYRCNSACTHCRYAKKDWSKTRGDMPRGTALSVIRQAAGLGIPRLVFFGGEPLLYAGLDGLVRAAAGRGLFTELDTNGALLSPARIRALKRAGLASAMISLHGADRAAHDSVSGRGSFDKALEAVRRCSSAGLLTYVSACVFDGRGQAGMLKKLFRVAARRGAHGARLLPLAGRRGGADRASNRAVLDLVSSGDTSGFARTCLTSPSSCRASRGGIVYVAPSGAVTRCPYSARAAGDLKKSPLAAILAGGAGKRPGIFC